MNAEKRPRVLRLEVPIESEEELAALEGALIAARAAELSQIRRRGDRLAFGYGSNSARETMDDEIDQAERRWTMLDRLLLALKSASRTGKARVSRSGQGGPPKETGKGAPTSVEDYLAGLPDDRRAVVEELRRTINAAAPEATETIAYGMPALRSHGGQFLVSYAAYKKHYSLFPASGAVVEALGEELTPFLAGKGTIQFPADRAIPSAVVTKIVKFRVAENKARADREGRAG